MKRLGLLPALLLVAGGLTAAPAPSVLPFVVMGMTPGSGSLHPVPPTTITLTLSGPVDPATVTLSTVLVARSGADNVFNTPDDVQIVPTSVAVVGGGDQIQVDLTGIALPIDQYRVRLSGTVEAPAPVVGHWPLDENTGPTATDVTGNGNPGTHVNGPGFIAGKWGNGLHLNGIDQLVEVADNNLFSLPAGASGGLSVSAWVRLAALPPGGRYPIVSKATDGNFEYGLYVNTNGTVSFTVFQPDGSVYGDASGGAFTPGVWHHVTGTVQKGVSVKVYLDGVPLFNRLDFAGASANGTAPLRFGQSGSGAPEFLEGDIDDVRIFGIELSPVRVRDLASFGNAVRSTSSALLDGEFNGTFPSGDGGDGGDFTGFFLVTTESFRLTAMDPAPGSNLTTAPGSIDLTFNRDLDPATASAGSIRLFRAGPNGILGDGDDVTVTPFSVSLLSSNQIRISLLGVPMADDIFGLTVFGNPPTVPGRINYWSFDNGVGGVATDSAGSANGIVVGPQWVPGRVGNALHYNGISDRVVPAVPPVAPPWTAAMWVRRENSPGSDARLMDPETFTGGTLRLESYPNTTFVGIAVYTVTEYPTTYTAPDDGTWVHLTFVGSAQTHLYVNGVFEATMPASINLPRFYLGSHGYNTMKGTLDDVQVWGRVLNPSEIQTVAALGGAVRDLNQNRLDGEFTGTFPSGNQISGGNFLATFSLNAQPGTFSLVSPADGAGDQSRTPTYSWSASGGATSYTLEVTTDNTFVSVDTALVTGITGTSSTPGASLAYATTYYWRVKANDSAGATLGNGSPFSFTTIPPPPGAFSLTSPSNGAVDVPLLPTFTWSAASGATSYTVAVATDSAFNNVVLSTSVPGTSHTAVTPLNPVTLYYWRVTAVNPTGSTPVPGGAFSFTTQLIPPTAFGLSAPTDAAVDVATHPAFSWGTAPYATGYDLEVATDIGFTTLVVNQTGLTGTSFTPTKQLAASTVHYWRVTATNTAGSTAATGPPRTFTTAAGPPGVDIIVTGGGCGLLGLEILILLALRRRRIR